MKTTMKTLLSAASTRRLVTFIMCAMFMTFCLHSPLQAETFRIAATNSPPYEFEQPENALRGFDLEVVEEAFRIGHFSENVEDEKLPLRLAGLESPAYNSTSDCTRT